ncbi:MAG: chromate transporter [Dehalobacterium sp.]
MEIMELFITFFKIGLFSFGGGYAMIPLMENEVISVHHWLSMSEMIDVITISQMTPGPIAINLATFVGFKTAGLGGALTATLGVVLPSFVIVLFIARSYEKFKELDVVRRVFKGIRPMTVALVGSAAFLVARTSLIDISTLLIALGSFFVLKYTKLSLIAVIIIAGFFGIVLYS